MRKLHSTVVASALLLLAWTGFAATPAAAGEGPLGFLAGQDSSQAWVVDSGFDPLVFYGQTFVPPWQIGDDALTRIGLAGGPPRILSTTLLGGGGTVMSFSLSPDGDTALVSTLLPHQILVVQGLSAGLPQVTATLPMNLFPVSFGIAPDGRSAIVGLQRNGPGNAAIAVVHGLPGSATVEIVDLGIHADVLSAVESVDYSPDGRRVLVHTGLHQHPDPPLFFLPDVALQVLKLGNGGVAVSDPFIVPPEPFLPPQPPFDGLDTGIAIGDSAIACDGDTAIVPSIGAPNLGQPDARVLLIGGVRSGNLHLKRILTLFDGVGIAPFQVTVGPDCDAWVSNSFELTVTRIGGLMTGNAAAVTLTPANVTYPFPSDLGATPNNERLVVHHPRAPLDGTPPAAVTAADIGTGAPLGPPLTGPVVGWLEVKDATLETHPAGLIDHLRALATPDNQTETQQLIRRVERAVDLAAGGQMSAAWGQLRAFRSRVSALERQGVLGPFEARLFLDIASVAVRVLGDQGRADGIRGRGRVRATAASTVVSERETSPMAALKSRRLVGR